MRKSVLMISAALVTVTAAALIPSAAMADDRPELVIEDFVGTIMIETGSGEITVTEEDNMKGVNLVTLSDGLKIDGGISKPNGKKCKGYYGNWVINNNSGRFGGYEDLEDYPVLTVQAPADTVLVIRNAIPFIEAGDLGGVDANVDYCGKVYLGDIDGDVRVNLNGSGDVQGGSAHNVDINLRGSGDVVFEDVDAAEISLRGSGDINLGNAGPTSIGLQGSGDIRMEDVSGPLTVSLSGSGDIEIGDVSGATTAELRGSGDIMIDSVTANKMTLNSRGSGDIDVEDGQVDMLSARSSGSANVEFGGTAVDAELRASGSADVIVYRVTGNLDESDSGSADVTVRNRK